MSHLRLESFFLVCLCGLGITLSSADPTIKLSSGYDMPIIGLGTWQMSLDEADAAVTAALENGYKHIDAAYNYQNEEAIGRALKKWFDRGGKRQDIFVTTKLSEVGARAADVEKYLKISLEKMGLDYVDMYLIHLPVGFFSHDGPVFDFSTDHVAIWKAMEAQVKAGRVKSIGISNFNESQVLNVYNNAEIKPSNLQIELHVFNQPKPLRELLEHPTIVKIAEAHKKSAAQVLLRHAVQNGIIVIPKSTKAERVKENHDILDFELTADEMKEMNDLDKGEDGRTFNFQVFKGIETHPEYPWSSQINNNN